MIRNTFSILNGIGGKLEKRLWREGILTWEDFVVSFPDFITPGRKTAYDITLSEYLENLERGNSVFFGHALKRTDHWRLFDSLKGDAVCLDIETNGLNPAAGGRVTVIGLYDGYDYRSLIRGRDLTPESLEREISGFKYLITFFGSAFDVPFIKNTLGIEPDMPHFDLCFGARKIGLRGGLKKIETALGIERPEHVAGMDGYDAVLLWEQARRGSSEALDLLVAYNREDTVNLMGMAGKIYNGLRESTGIEEYLHARA